MTDSQHLITGLVAATSVVFAYKLWRQHTSLKLPLPPHPKSYPLIGNLLAMPQSNEHLAFIQLGQELHSDIISLSALGTVIVVVNNVQGATDLLEKRSSIYSDRPSLPMVTEPSLLNWGECFAVLGYNGRLKTYRRLIYPWLQKSAVEKSHTELQHQARLLLQRMLQLSGQQTWSEDLEKELYRMFSMKLAHSVYGYQMKGPDDAFTASLREAVGNVSKAGLASNFLVNIFPSLKHVPEWFPGASWKRVAREWRQQQETAVDSSYNWTKSKIASGSDDESIIRSLLENTRDIDDIEGYTKQIAVALFGGGTDTTTSTLVSFILAMVLFPETQAKAQHEIDTVVSNGRLPAMEDRPRLPYVERLITEVQRWCPAVPIGIPHACRQDDIYQGYLIPKGAIVVGNIWAMSRDSTTYKVPEIFNPDRFEDASVPPAPTFGFGRRICPGINYAEPSLFISIASILATFTIGMAKDEHGNDIVPVMEAENSIIYHQKPFRLTLNPRSDQHERIIRTGEL